MTISGFDVRCNRQGSSWRAIVMWQGQQLYEGFAGTRERAMADARRHIRQVLTAKWWR